MSQVTPDAWIERNPDDPGDPYYEGGEPEGLETEETTESSADMNTQSDNLTTDAWMKKHEKENPIFKKPKLTPNRRNMNK